MFNLNQTTIAKKSRSTQLNILQGVQVAIRNPPTSGTLVEDILFGIIHHFLNYIITHLNTDSKTRYPGYTRVSRKLC